MSTPRRREHGGTSATGMPGSGGAPKTWFFIGKHENAHHAQARAQFSKCAPRAGESSILPTPDGAHDHVRKQNEHRAAAGAPFSIKMSPRAGERPKSAPAERRKCYSSSGAHLQISFWASLMSATRIASDDFEADKHLDSAGDSFGATAQGVPRRGISGVGKRKRLFRANEE